MVWQVWDHTKLIAMFVTELIFFSKKGECWITYLVQNDMSSPGHTVVRLTSRCWLKLPLNEADADGWSLLRIHDWFDGRHQISTNVVWFWKKVVWLSTRRRRSFFRRQHVAFDVTITTCRRHNQSHSWLKCVDGSCSDVNFSSRSYS